MAHIKIVIDGKTLLDKDVGEWTPALPELEKHLAPGAKPEPWMQAVLIPLTSAVMANKPFTAKIKTRIGGWTLDVTT